MYQRAAELSPSDSQAYLELAKVSQKLGRQEEADQVYQKKSIDQAADTTIALLNKTGINPGRLSIGQTWPDGSVKKKSKPYSNRS
jgi:hypothetical protein